MIVLPHDLTLVGCRPVSVLICVNQTVWYFSSFGADYSITTESDVIVEKDGSVVDTIHSDWMPRLGEGAGVFTQDITDISVGDDGLTFTIFLTDGWKLVFSAEGEDENKLYVRRERRA